jgi:DNA-binding response OmpR family regulator
VDRPKANEQALVVADDVVRAGGLARALQEGSFVPTLAFTPGQTLACAGMYEYRVVVVDLPIGPADLRNLTTDLRARSGALLIVVTPHAAFPPDASADCTLPPGTAYDEIVARARALVTMSTPPELAAILSWGPLELDVRKRVGRWYLKPVRLTSIQFRIMEVLVLAAGSMVTARELARRVWGSGIVEDEDRIRAHIWRIRKLIEPRPSVPEFLLTVRGEGFRLADHDIEEAEIDLDGLGGPVESTNRHRRGISV